MSTSKLWRWEPLPDSPDPQRSATVARALFYMVAFGTLTGFCWAYIQGFYRAKGFPLNTFLFNPTGHLNDILLFFPLLEKNLPYANLAVYPPLNFVLMEPFSWIGRTPSTVLWVALGAGGMTIFMFAELNFIGLLDRVAISLGVVCFSYPFLFGFDRGNFEILVTLALAGGVYCFQRRNYLASGAAFGVAGALKIYPIVFVSLLLIRHKWVAAIVAVVTAAVLTDIASAAYGFTLPEMLNVLKTNSVAYNETYVINDAGLAWGNSFYGAAKVVLTQPGEIDQVRAIFAVYGRLIPLGLVAAALAAWLLPLRLWEQVTLLTVALVGLPAASADYRLLHFVIPAALFVRLGSESRLRWWYVVFFALLLVPKAFVWLRPDGTNLGVIVNPVVMALLGAMVITTGVARLIRKNRSGTATFAPEMKPGTSTVSSQ